MTGQWGDLANADVLLTCGSNHAECHPISMKWVHRAVDKGAKWIVVDPRFTRTAAQADIYCPIRPGTDIAFYGGMVNYILENDLIQREYVVNYTNASYLIDPEFNFDVETGTFTGWNAEKRSYEKKTWGYQVESESQWDTSKSGAYSWTKEPGVPSFKTPTLKNPKKDPTLQDPNCVYQIMKKHYSRYDMDTVADTCGMDKETLDLVYKTYTATGEVGKAGTILYALGQTQHSSGTGNIRMMAIIQLLLGNVGIPGGQVAALRGEPNVQGATDLCLAPGDMPGYLQWPQAARDKTIGDYCAANTPADGYWANKPKFLVSYLKSFFGENATAENDYGYNWLPKVDDPKSRSLTNVFHLIEKGVIKGYFFWGQNPIQSHANAKYARGVMENLDWLVFNDMFMTETASFWDAPDMKDHAKDIKTECYFLPCASLLEKNGTVVQSGRVMQWRQQASKPAGDTKSDLEIIYLMQKKVRELYEKEGGVFPEPILNAKWDYEGDDGKPDMRKVAWELNGYSTDGATDDFKNNTPKLLDAFSKLKADGSTASAVWIYTGYYGNAAAPLDPAQQGCGRRGLDDPGNNYLFPKFGFSWPANRRILYNRASCDMNGKPWNPDKVLVEWNGEKWVTNDVPDFVAAKANPDGTSTPVPPNNKAFMMCWEQNACLFSNAMNDMPIPEHYEPYETAAKNPFNGAGSNPTMLFTDDPSIKDNTSSSDEYPYVATTYSPTEHWSTGQETHGCPAINEMLPHQYIEIPTELANEKGIGNGDKVRITNARSSIVMQAMVTDRLSPLTVNGRTMYTVGMVHSWGFAHPFAKGDLTNELIPNVGDPNSFIQESKAFLVNIEKA